MLVNEEKKKKKKKIEKRVDKKQTQNLTHQKEGKQNTHRECTKLPQENRTHCECTKLPKIQQLKPNKKLLGALLSGEEENKKKNKLKGHVVRTQEKKSKQERKFEAVKGKERLKLLGNGKGKWGKKLRGWGQV